MVIAASLTIPTSSVSEASGRAYVCVNITNANSIPAEGAVIQVFVQADAGINPATGELSNNVYSYYLLTMFLLLCHL